MFLLGDGTYPHDVIEISDLQAELYAFLGRIAMDQDVQYCIAMLDFDRTRRVAGDRVSVAIDGRIVGSCPSFLGNQIREWLAEWNYSQARVACQAQVVHRRGIRSNHTDRFIVRLDIVVPFKMTTF